MTAYCFVYKSSKYFIGREYVFLIILIYSEIYKINF